MIIKIKAITIFYIFNYLTRLTTDLKTKINRCATRLNTKCCCCPKEFLQILTGGGGSTNTDVVIECIESGIGRMLETCDDGINEVVKERVS